MRALAQRTSVVIRLPMLDLAHLEDWIHPDGRVIAIGDACHPLAVSLSYLRSPSTALILIVLCTARLNIQLNARVRGWRDAWPALRAPGTQRPDRLPAAWRRGCGSRSRGTRSERRAGQRLRDPATARCL